MFIRISLIALLLLPRFLLAQLPQKMSYQAIVRNNNNVVVSKPIGMRTTILQGSASGAEAYQEIYNPNPQTNSNGLVSLEIGGGIPLRGKFETINWAEGPFFLKTEIDPDGGTNYSINAITQLLSVPFALYAGKLAGNVGKTTVYVSGELANQQLTEIIANDLGSGTVEILIEDCPNITNIDLSKIKQTGNVIVKNIPNLETLDLSQLETCSSLEISDCPKLSKLVLTALKKTNQNLLFSNTGLSSLSLAKLAASNAVTFHKNDLLADISLPLLANGKFFSIWNNRSLNSFSLPVIQTIHYLYFAQNVAISGLSLSSLKTIKEGLIVSENPSLSSLSMSGLSNFEGTVVMLEKNQLPSSQINILLNKFVNLTTAVSGKFFNFSEQKNAAPPTGQGLEDKATLISRGNTIVTD